jgi:hypothetical protein
MKVLKLLSNWWPPSWIRLGYKANSKKWAQNIILRAAEVYKPLFIMASDIFHEQALETRHFHFEATVQIL